MLKQKQNFAAQENDNSAAAVCNFIFFWNDLTMNKSLAEWCCNSLDYM